MVADAAEQRREIAGHYAALESVIHLDHGRDRAGERAVQLFERRRAVGRRLAGADAEPLLARSEQLAAAHHAAADAGAHPHDPPSRPREPQLGIVARDAPDLALRHAQVRRDAIERLGREPALGLLRRPERRQEPRALTRERGERVRRVGHRRRRATARASRGSPSGSAPISPTRARSPNARIRCRSRSTSHRCPPGRACP